MLYRSTRNKIDSYTSYRALRLHKGLDGGFILPLRVPVFDSAEIEQMRNVEPLCNIARFLNLFFGTDFTHWDIESTIGKTPLQTVSCGQKILVTQWWKNPASRFSYYQQALLERICPDKGAKQAIWSKVAVRISLIAATVLSIAEDEVDVAVIAGDFEQALAVCFCRRMGLPIRKILIACNENSNVWDFVHRGEMHCGAALQKTAYPEQDKVIPDLFEAYFFLAYGYEETQRFLDTASNCGDYKLPEETQIPATDNFFVSVVGQERIPAVISSFYANNALTVNPYTAFSLGVLQDYRAKAGESCTTVIFEDVSP